MTRGLFITGTGTDVGKTYVGALVAKALRDTGKRVGVYKPVASGCETRDGKLLVFETGTNMVVHAMDPPDLFPYKQAQMEKVFGAFAAMLRNRAACVNMDRATADAA